jgi:multidrug transporter EmrE-like cation transporter
LVLAIGLTGGKLILYLIVAGLHTIFAVGIFMRQRWAYVLTITYALFQAVGMSLWCLIGVLTLLGEPATQDKIQFFILSGIVVPFLGWTIVYLLKRLRSDSFD